MPYNKITNISKIINIAEILKDKPVGTKLYDYLCNRKVELESIDILDGETIIWYRSSDDIANYSYSELGTIRGHLDGLQILLPSKSMRDWSKFAWKKGDVLVCKEPFTTVLFAGFANEEYTEINTAYSYEGDTKEYYRENIYPTEGFFKVGEGDKLRFIAYLEKEYKGKLNLNTLEIEDIKPKWTPKPFDKCVWKEDSYHIWQADFVAFINSYGVTPIRGVHIIKDKKIQVLPYNEETAKLIGTTKSLEDLK